MDDVKHRQSTENHSERLKRWARIKLETHAHIWWQAAKAALDPEMYIIAAGNAFFGLFSFFPLILLAVAILSLWLDPLLAETEIVNQLEFIAPGLGQLLDTNLRQIVRSRGSITGLALFSLLWSSSTIFTMMSRTVDRIFHGQQTRRSWQHRGLGILSALVTSMLLMVISFGGSTFAAVIRIDRFIPDLIFQLYGYISQFIALFVGCFLFGFLYRFLPSTRPSWREVIPGALASGLMWELAKRAFLFYITSYLSTSNLVYGSVTSVIAFLAWGYISGLIFFFGAYLAVAYNEYNERTNTQQIFDAKA